MTRILIILLTCGSLGLAVTNTPVKLCQDNNRYLLLSPDNHPMFLIGYHAHNLDLGNSIGYDTLLAANAQNRINYMRYFPFSARMADTPGDHQWLMFLKVDSQKLDLGQWNEANWLRIPQHLTFMRNHGIIAHVSLFEGCLRWPQHPFNPKFNINTDLGDLDHDGDGNGCEPGEFYDYQALTSPNATPQQKALKYYQEKQIERLIAETSPFPNVIYEIGNELPDPGIDWIHYWVNFIRQRCDNLITYNGDIGLSDPVFAGATAHVQKESRVTTPFAPQLMQKNKFIASSSDGGPITNIGSDGARRCLWQAFTAALSGWLNYSSDFYVTNPDEFYYSPESPAAYNLRKGLYYYNAAGFIHDWQLPLPHLHPANEIILQKPPHTQASCLAGRGEYIIYLQGNCPGGALLLDLKPATPHAYWYNPTTGAFFQHHQAQPGQNACPIPPTKQDIILYVGRPRTEINILRIDNPQSDSPTIALQVSNPAEKLDKKSVKAEYSTDNLKSFITLNETTMDEPANQNNTLTVTLNAIPFNTPSATHNWIRLIVNTTANHQATATVPIIGRENLTLNLDNIDTPDGLTHIQNQDGRTELTHQAGKACRKNADPTGKIPDRYLYFAIDNLIAFAEPPRQYQLQVTYLDTPDGCLQLQYDAAGEGASNIYRSAGNAPFNGTNQWRTHTFKLNDAFFADRQNNGADFRLFLGENRTGYIHQVILSRQ